MTRLAAVLTILALPITACGSSSDDKKTTATKTPAASGGKLSEDQLFAAHDAFYGCLRDLDVGTVTAYSDGEASVANGGPGQSQFDPKVSAPDAITELTDGGTVQFVGLRDNTRKPPKTADVDYLIADSADDAAAAAREVHEESGMEVQVDGRVVQVALKGDAPDVAGCSAQAKAAATGG